MGAEVSPQTFRISAVLIEDEEGWSAQCLEYDIAAQAKTLPDLYYEIERVLISHVAVSMELGKKPFEAVEAAPQRYWDMFDAAKLSVKGEETPFRIPSPGEFPNFDPHFKIAAAKALAAERA